MYEADGEHEDVHQLHRLCQPPQPIRRKRKIEEVEEEEDFLSSNDKEEKPKNAKLKTKQASPRGFHIPKGSVIGAATETAYELSQEHDKNKAATTKKPKKVAAAPKTKKTRY